MAIVTCGPNCTTEIKNSGRACGHRVVEFEGLVLATYERNGYHDSDFYAVVWNPATRRPEHREYGSTSSWTYHNHATVDATPDVAEAAAAWYRGYVLDREMTRVKNVARAVVKGKTVRSLTTRGKNAGVRGVVRWVGETRYGKRVGVAVEGEEKLRYLDADRVAVLDPDTIDAAEVVEIEEWAATVEPTPAKIANAYRELAGV